MVVSGLAGNMCSGYCTFEIDWAQKPASGRLACCQDACEVSRPARVGRYTDYRDINTKHDEPPDVVL